MNARPWGFRKQEESIMALQPTNRTRNIFPVHADLRERVGTSNLLCWCLEAPLIVTEDSAQLSRKNICGFRPQMMLTLLSFCYASGYYGSEDIARAISSDRMVRYICARTYPDAHAIRRFRRFCRGALDQALNYVLRRAAIEMTGNSDLPPELEQQILSTAQEKIELAVVMDRHVTEG
jgi:transposase-like protein DUF772